MKSVIGGVLALSFCFASAAQAHLFPYVFGLNNRQVVDPTDSAARGVGRLTYNHHTFNYDLNLRITGIALDDLLDVGPNGTPIGVFYAPKGQNGPQVLDPGFFGEFVQDGDAIRLTLEDIRLGGVQGNLDSNVFLNEGYLYDGHLYMQIFTQQYPGGEIRGQLPVFQKLLNDRDNWREAGLDIPPHRIPAPGGAAVLAIAGLSAFRRRR